MPREYRLIIEVQGWLVKARDDLDMAGRALEGGPPIPYQAAHHAQQAAEKCMKGFLTLCSVKVEKTHDLDQLGKQCAAADSTLAELCERVAQAISRRYAVAERYPPLGEEPSEDEARQALALARELYDAVRARLPAEARP